MRAFLGYWRRVLGFYIQLPIVYFLFILNYKKKRILNKKIYFIGPKGLASTIMRGEQVVKKLKERGVDANIKYSFKNIKKNSIVVLVREISFYQLLFLMYKNCIIVWDFIDYEKYYRIRGYMKLVDWIIFCNKAGELFFKKKLKRNFNSKIIYLHWDPRLKSKEKNKFSIKYFGTASEDNAIYAKKLGIPCIKSFESHLKVGPYTPFNYSFRKTNNIMSELKPMAKISSAAACGANLISSKGKSFLELLPENYPYFCENNIDAVISKINFAKKTYKKREWFIGLKIMKDIKKKTDLNLIVNNYIDLFKEIKKNNI